jgi:hypothetical protein
LFTSLFPRSHSHRWPLSASTTSLQTASRQPLDGNLTDKPEQYCKRAGPVSAVRRLPRSTLDTYRSALCARVEKHPIIENHTLPFEGPALLVALELLRTVKRGVPVNRQRVSRGLALVLPFFWLVLLFQAADVLGGGRWLEGLASRLFCAKIPDFVDPVICNRLIWVHSVKEIGGRSSRIEPLSSSFSDYLLLLSCWI